MNTETISVLLWLVPLCPLVGYFICAYLGRISTAAPTGTDAHDAGHSHDARPAGQKIAGAIATLLVTVAFVLSLFLVLQVQGLSGGEKRLFSPRFDWMIAPAVGQDAGFHIGFGLFLDNLNGLMLLIITGIGALIHLYSIGYMSHDRNYARYFSYLNLFVFFMLLLVMGGSLPVLFIGWEGVGLASYLLIGFWPTRQSATDAGKKAFIVNRIGDCALLIAMFLLYKYFGTLDFYGTGGILTKEGLEAANGNGYSFGVLFGIGVTTLVPLLMLLGATGKSAQIPLFIWLPDAMEGPTPVSALIHAATMVTGGIYLMCRAHALFLLSPEAMTIVAVIGISTAFVAATIALTQNDIKRVLAYSTVSQLGYMFLACGVGAFSAAMFHVMTHAFFKALLFLGAGSVIRSLDGEQDMRRMGNLRKYMPQTHLTMLIATLAIAGFPLTSGFWSKDEILLNAFAGTNENGLGSPILWAVGLFISALTAFYMIRLMCKTFYGGRRYSDAMAGNLHESPLVMTAPLLILAFFSAVAGFVNAAPFKITALENFLGETTEWRDAVQFPTKFEAIEWPLLLVSGAVAIVVILATLLAFRRTDTGNLSTEAAMARNPLWRYFDSLWGIDRAYKAVFAVEGLNLARWFSQTLDRRVIESATVGMGGFVGGIAGVFRRWQSGYVRNYALGMLLGVIVIVLSLVGLSALR